MEDSDWSRSAFRSLLHSPTSNKDPPEENVTYFLSSSQLDRFPPLRRQAYHQGYVYRARHSLQPPLH
jgi:hypothetical protein